MIRKILVWVGGVYRNGVPLLEVKGLDTVFRGDRSIKWPLRPPSTEVLWLCTVCRLPIGIKSGDPPAQWTLDSLIPKETPVLTCLDP